MLMMWGQGKLYFCGNHERLDFAGAVDAKKFSWCISNRRISLYVVNYYVHRCFDVAKTVEYIKRIHTHRRRQLWALGHVPPRLPTVWTCVYCFVVSGLI